LHRAQQDTTGTAQHPRFLRRNRDFISEMVGKQRTVGFSPKNARS
jgi:hypothetical protein